VNRRHEPGEAAMLGETVSTSVPATSRSIMKHKE